MLSVSLATGVSIEDLSKYTIEHYYNLIAANAALVKDQKKRIEENKKKNG